MLAIKVKLVCRINDDQIGTNIGWVNSAANNSIVLFAAAVKLPRRFKQFEEFAGGFSMLKVGGNADHVVSTITPFRSPPGCPATSGLWPECVKLPLGRGKPFLFELMKSNSTAGRAFEK